MDREVDRKIHRQGIDRQRIDRQGIDRQGIDRDKKFKEIRDS